MTFLDEFRPRKRTRQAKRDAEKTEPVQLTKAEVEDTIRSLDAEAFRKRELADKLRAELLDGKWDE